MCSGSRSHYLIWRTRSVLAVALWQGSEVEEVEGELPSLLKPHAVAIEALRMGSKDKAPQLQSLYSKILWDALHAMPLVLLLDDIDSMDQQSVAVLRAIVDKLRSYRRGPATAVRGHQGQNHHSAIVCTSRREGVLGHSYQMETKDIMGSPALLSLRLLPLSDTAVAEVARDILGSSVDASLAEYIVGNSPATPAPNYLCSCSAIPTVGLYL